MPTNDHLVVQLLTEDEINGIFWLFCLNCRTLAQREAWYLNNPCRRPW